MKERPILFSAPMVRAILSGQKTQTRRVLKQATGPSLSVGIEAYQRQQWRPIETAPTNGQPVLLFARLVTFTASTRVVGAFIDGEWLAQHYSGDRPVLAPSHWMPLPDFPGVSHA